MKTWVALSILLTVQLYFISSLAVLASDATPVNSPGNGPRFVTEELIVKFKSGVSTAEIEKINNINGTSVRAVNSIARFMRLRINEKGRSVRQLVKKYREHKQVEYAEPNYIVHTTALPNDPGLSQLWGLNNTGQTGGASNTDIDAPEAWDIQTGDPSVIVAVIDTGVDYNHQDLAANIWVNSGEITDNGIDDDGNGFVDDVRGWDFVSNDNDPFDDNDHGTHVAGTIAAVGDNETGVAGVNWTAQIIPLKFLDAQGNGTVTNAIKAIQYATLMGAKIANNSWGGGGYSQALKDAIAAADAAGVLFIVAAGNDGSNNDVSSFYPASYDLPNIVAVAATDHNDSLAAFSNYGPSTVELAAPGDAIYSTTTNNTYGYKSGTSMATPHVSGVATLLLAEFPALTHYAIKDRILNATDSVISLKGMVSSGGRLNAHSALLGVMPPELPPATMLFADDIEGGINGWTLSGDTSLWHQSTNRSTSPTGSWYYGIEGPFDYNTSSRNQGELISPPIDLTDYKSSTLSFKHFLDTEESKYYDKVFVSVSSDGGATFTDIFTKLTTSGAFAQEDLNIAAFDGEVIQVKFSFDTVDSVYNDYEGWYLDDVIVTGQVAEDPSNIAPVAATGPDQTVNDTDGDQLESVTLDGSASFDPDGEIVAYQWKEGETVLAESVTDSVNFTVGTHSLTLTVTDNAGATASDELTVIVKPNQPPSAVAGPDQTLLDTDRNGSEIITLSGTSSYDPDGSLVTYEWKEGGTVLGTTDTITGSFAVGTHSITLTVTDNGSATDSDIILLTINAPPPIGPSIHVARIDVTLFKRGSTYTAKGSVSIVDENGALAQGSTLTAEWSLNGALLAQVSNVTSKKGAARLDLSKVSANPGDNFTLTIIDVSKVGFVYEPTKNLETSDWALAP